MRAKYKIGNHVSFYDLNKSIAIGTINGVYANTYYEIIEYKISIDNSHETVRVNESKIIAHTGQIIRNRKK